MRLGRAGWRVAAAWPMGTRVLGAGTVALGVLAGVISCQGSGRSASTEPGVVESADASGLGPVAGRIAEPEIRVRIVAGAEGVTLAAVDGGELELRDPGGGVRRVRGSVRLGASDVSGAGGARGAAVGPIVAASVSGSGVRVDGRTIPGEVTVRPGSAKGVDATAELGMELYLEGVLAGELLTGWPEASYRAQAVAARSYALHERDRARRAGRAFDVESTTLDQVYAGANGDARARRAVQSTRGVVLVDRGRLLRAYYSSTCGDRPASALGVWGTEGGQAFNAAPALQAWPRPCPCDSSPLYRWRVARPEPELRARLRAWGAANGDVVRGIGEIRRIEVIERNPAGRPERHRVVDTAGGAYELRAESLRMASNHPAPGLAAITRETRVPSGDLTAEVGLAEVGLAGGGGGGDGGVVTFTGQGFGHGVGLCQWGAKGLAEAGEPWESIVRRYYPGAQLRTLW